MTHCALVKWLVTVHTGSMFAYPCGGERGASSLTFLLFTLGAGVLWRRGQKVILLDLPGTVRGGPRGRRDGALSLRRPGAARVAGAGHAIPGAQHLPARRRRGAGLDRVASAIARFRLRALRARAGPACRCRDHPPGGRRRSPLPIAPCPAGPRVRTAVLARLRPGADRCVCAGIWASANGIRPTSTSPSIFATR